MSAPPTRRRRLIRLPVALLALAALAFGVVRLATGDGSAAVAVTPSLARPGPGPDALAQLLRPHAATRRRRATTRAPHPERSRRRGPGRPRAPAVDESEGPVPAPVAGVLGQRPSRARPLQLLVTGDSLSSFIGVQLANLTRPSGRVRVVTQGFDSTGLLAPKLDWRRTAAQEVARFHPDAVVMILGANDGYGIGSYPPTSPRWAPAYAQRVAAVMRTIVDGGRRPVFWSSPSAARPAEFNAIYANESRAIPLAAAAVPGASYVDIYSTIAGGRYTDVLRIAGRPVRWRQSDGVHYTLEGAVVPARIILQAVEQRYGTLTG